MRDEFALAIVSDFERGLLSRRQLVSRLTGLGAALAALSGVAEARAVEGGTFDATGLNHIAIDVRSVPASRDWYIKHLGLKVMRDGGEDNCFLGSGEGFFLTLFKGEKPGLNHYCYSIKGYDPDKAEQTLKDAGLLTPVIGNGYYVAGT